MSIKKQEFYEGAALHILAREGQIQSLRYQPPLFHLNERIWVLLKYSTRKRSPWGFTFMTSEHDLLSKIAPRAQAVVALVCGSDGVAAFRYDELAAIAPEAYAAAHVACYRNLGQHYEIWGPQGSLPGKVAPSEWRRILNA